jgi:hypothetical protein
LSEELRAWELTTALQMNGVVLRNLKAFKPIANLTASRPTITLKVNPP